jgi:membrane carboxypeptidase/penicillin-binding protein
MMTHFKQHPIRYGLLITLIALLIGGGLFAYVWIFDGLPSLDRIQAGLALPSTRIYDRNGALLYEILPPNRGVIVPSP